MSRGPRPPRLLAATLAIALLALAGVAAPQDSLETAKRKELEAIQRAAREKREAAQKLKVREGQEMTKLRRTEKELGTTRRRLQKLQRQRQTLGNQLDITEANLERSLHSLGQQQSLLARRLRRAYMTGAGRELEFLLSTQSFAQLLARWDYLVMIAQQDQVILDGIRGEKEQVEADKLKLESNLRAVTRNESQTTASSKRLANLREQRATTVASIQNQRAAFEAAARELERTAASIKSLLARLEKQRIDNEKTGRSPQPYAGDFARGQGQLDWPVRGDLVGRFGNEVHPKWGTVTPNNGIDIACAVGTAVRAVAKGRVDFVSDDYGTYGQMVLLNHGDGFYTMYAHLSTIAVSVNQEVIAGATIGRSGDTGSLKGPVLHFEVRKGGAALDPMGWLR